VIAGDDNSNDIEALLPVSLVNVTDLPSHGKGEGTVRGSVTDWGSVDGVPAKIVYTPGSRKKDIYWGGRGSPDGPGHNHAVVVDTNPDAARFIRITDA
jgi:hypothetical protein